MRTLANIIWHIPFLGFVNAFITFLIGSLLVLTIIGAPLGLGLIQYSKFLLTPFSSEMIDGRELKKESNQLWSLYGFLVRVIYFPLGLILAIVTLFQIVMLCFTIVGIPVAVILSKSLSTFFNPVHKKSVPRVIAQSL